MYYSHNWQSKAGIDNYIATNFMTKLPPLSFLINCLKIDIILQTSETSETIDTFFLKANSKTLSSSDKTSSLARKLWLNSTRVCILLK